MIKKLLELICSFIPLFKLQMSYGSFPRPLTAKEEKEALSLLASGDKAAREKLITHNLRLVSHISKKYYAGRHEPDDIVSIGTIGLIKAVDSYNPQRGTKFSSYAARCIENEILMQFRFDNKAKLDVSLNEPLESDAQNSRLSVTDVLCDETDIQEEIELKKDIETVRRLVEKLPDRQRMVLTLRFGLDGKKQLTQQQIADLMGISRSYISRIEKKAVETLREKME